MFYRLTFVLIITAALAGGKLFAQQLIADNSDFEITRLRNAINQLAIDHGRMDQRLIEPLQQLSRLLQESHRYEDAHDVLNDLIQFSRLSEGLYTSSQHGFVIRKAHNLADSGDWRNANKVLLHLDSLLRHPMNEVDEGLVNSLLQLSALQIRAVTEDDTALQGRHFRSAEKTNELATRVALVAWGEKDVRLVPIIYKWVLLQYLQSRAVDKGGFTGISLRTYTGTGLARTRTEAELRFYQLGLSGLGRIRNIYRAQALPNREAVALSDMHIADWQVLFSKREEAIDSYLRSNNGLLEAGLDQRDIDIYFQNPSLLPAAEFIVSLHPSSSAAGVASLASSPGNLLAHSFMQWSADFPYTAAPLDNGYSRASQEQEYALFSLDLLGLEEITRWYRGQYSNSISVATSLKLMENFYTGTIDPLELEDSIMKIQFRPMLIEGLPQNVNTTLRYQFKSSR